MGYIVQNAARLLRALFELALAKNFAETAKICLNWCKLVDKRMLPFHSVLRQFSKESNVGKLTNVNKNITEHGYLGEEILYQIEKYGVELSDIVERDTARMHALMINDYIVRTHLI